MILTLDTEDDGIQVEIETFEDESHAPINICFIGNEMQEDVSLTIVEAKKLAQNLKLAIETIEEGPQI